MIEDRLANYSQHLKYVHVLLVVINQCLNMNLRSHNWVEKYPPRLTDDFSMLGGMGPWLFDALKDVNSPRPPHMQQLWDFQKWRQLSKCILVGDLLVGLQCDQFGCSVRTGDMDFGSVTVVIS